MSNAYINTHGKINIKKGNEDKSVQNETEMKTKFTFLIYDHKERKVASGHTLFFLKTKI